MEHPAMISFDRLTELFEIATAPWSQRPWANAAPPTPGSIDRIQRQLGIRIPEDFVRLAMVCPSYGSWLASIGEDFDNGLHITRLNQLFHDGARLHDGEKGLALPPHFIMLNHGHDLDCDCWDTMSLTASGEHPILYICLGTGTEPCGARFESFRAYAEDFVLDHAPCVRDKAQRRKAKRLIQEHGGE